MNWIVHGLDRKTGDPRLVNVSAESETAAIRVASKEGVVTEHIQAVLADAPRIVGGWSIFRDGTTRIRYIVALVWACRAGGASLLLVGLWFAKKLFVDADDMYVDPEYSWLYWAFTIGTIGSGAAVVLVGEVAGEIMQAKARINGVAQTRHPD